MRARDMPPVYPWTIPHEMKIIGRHVEKSPKIWLNVLMEKHDLQDIHQALVQHWGIWPIGENRIAWDALVKELGSRVEFLLKHDFERLMSCMYMVDVSEQRFSEAINLPEEDKPARVIAELILEREVQKMESRKRYTHSESAERDIRIEGQPRTTED